MTRAPVHGVLTFRATHHWFACWHLLARTALLYDVIRLCPPCLPGQNELQADVCYAVCRGSRRVHHVHYIPAVSLRQLVPGVRRPTTTNVTCAIAHARSCCRRCAHGSRTRSASDGLVRCDGDSCAIPAISCSCRPTCHLGCPAASGHSTFAADAPERIPGVTAAHGGQRAIPISGAADAQAPESSRM